ncbi:MAG: hypothetical protein KJ592_01130 [Nanoarchaeota archaeon]|nr:hypothetical protein [Nanoarchaeota archaeon]
MVESYEGFYEGGYSSFNSDAGNYVGFRMSAESLGFPGSTQTANQVGEAVNAMKQGVKAFEVTMLMPDTGETIPKQHFEEMRAIMKLSGVKPSVHGPVIDAAGFDEKGNYGNGFGREDAERRMFDTLQKAAMLDKKDGNVPVVFHASAGAPGAEFRPGNKEWGEEDKVMQRGAMINKETGEAKAIKREYKIRPEHPELLKEGVDYVYDEKGRIKYDSNRNPITTYYEGRPAGVLSDAESTIGSANLGDWEDKLMGVAQMNKHAEEIIGAAGTNLKDYRNAVISKDGKRIVDLVTGKEMPYFDEGEKEGQRNAYEQMKKADLFLENADLSFRGAFHQAYKYGTEKQKEELKKLSEKYAGDMNALEYKNRVKISNEGAGVGIWNPVDKHTIINESLNDLRKITDRNRGRDFDVPQVFQESNEFALEKAAETFGNLAKRSYDTLGGEKAPVIAVEHVHPGTALFETKDLKKLVERSRENFAKQLMEDKGMSESEARKIAASKLGVTWDVGHINLIKKYGFTDEDIVAQTKEMAPLVKHVHLTDNFGFADTHLAPGMGNVPIKKILEQLEKNGEFDKMRKIVEAPSMFQHFKKSPHGLTLAAFGSPLYSMKQGAEWGQALNVQGAYFGGYGSVNPSIHQSYFGGGFTGMPVELGGQAQGETSRFGNTPLS